MNPGTGTGTEYENGFAGSRIAAIDLYVVPLQKFKDFTTAYGVIRNEHVFVRLRTEDGAEGWGDTGHFLPQYSGERWESAFGHGEYLARETLGASPFDIGPLHTRWDATCVGNHQIKCAFDLAIYDLACRITNVSLADWLGGVVIDRFPVELNVPIGPVDVVLEDVERAMGLGVRTIGLKAGKPASPGVDHDVACFRAIRERFGYDFDLWIDFNQGASRGEALRAIHALEELGVGQVEQPLPAWDLDGMAYLASKVNVPLVADEAVWGPETVVAVAQKHAAEVIHAKLPKAGGIHGAVKLAAVCEALNLPLTMAGLGLANYGQAALMHFLAAHPISHEYPHKLRAGVLTYPQDVVETVPSFEDGAFVLPRGVGFGVNIDAARVDELVVKHSEIVQ
jgi:L-alanine-DL-glutamate epimerase-like enolase superfamily enzyme